MNTMKASTQHDTLVILLNLKASQGACTQEPYAQKLKIACNGKTPMHIIV